MIENQKILTDPISIEFVGGINDGLITHIPYLKDSIDIFNHNEDGTFTIRVYDLDKDCRQTRPKYRFARMKNV